MECLWHFCPDFKVNENNQHVLADVFRWCIRDLNGNLNPRKGLWICGKIGSGKSTIMKGILRFVQFYWLRDSGEKLNPKWLNVPVFCGRYAMDGFSVFGQIPMGLDELGTEIAPTNHLGNKLNVVAHLLNTIYDNNSPVPYVVTTNLTLTETLNSYGERAIDRIGHLFNIVKLQDVTHRDSIGLWNMIKDEQVENKQQ